MKLGVEAVVVVVGIVVVVVAGDGKICCGCGGDGSSC